MSTCCSHLASADSGAISAISPAISAPTSAISGDGCVSRRSSVRSSATWSRLGARDGLRLVGLGALQRHLGA